MKRVISIADTKTSSSRTWLIRYWQLTLLTLLTLYFLPSAEGQSRRDWEYDRDERYRREEWYDPSDWFDDDNYDYDTRDNRPPKNFWDSLFDFDSDYEGFDPEEFLAEQRRKERLRYQYEQQYQDPRILEDNWNRDQTTRRSTIDQDRSYQQQADNSTYSRVPQTNRNYNDTSTVYSGDSLDRSSTYRNDNSRNRYDTTTNRYNPSTDQYDRSTYRYDTRTKSLGLDTVEGELVRFDWLLESSGTPEAVRMTLRTQNNDVRYIQFGTTSYQEDMFTLRNGDSVEIQGQYIYLNDKPVLQAQEIRPQTGETASSNPRYEEVVRGRVVDMWELKISNGRIDGVLLELQRNDGLPLTFLIGTSEDYNRADETLRKFDKVELEGDFRTFEGEEIFAVTDIEQHTAATSYK